MSHSISALQEDLKKLQQPPFHILLVDDQPIIAAAIKQMLQDDQDFELHHCEKGTDAIRMATELKPTVILQDLVMPDMDGFQLVQYYQQLDATKDIPIIVLSSKDEAESKAKAFEKGANDYLVKLPNKIELLARLRYHNRTSIERMELRIALQELARISTTDALTNIANRRSFDDTFASEWKRAIRNKLPLSIALMDIDFFKQYNDNYGHQEGDECLIQVGECLKDNVQRPSDLAARYGGEEFIVLFPETECKGASSIAESLRQKIAELNIKHEFSSAAKHITVSIGVATITPHPDSSPEILLKEADTNLYKAKDSGRNQLHASCL